MLGSSYINSAKGEIFILRQLQTVLWSKDHVSNRNILAYPTDRLVQHYQLLLNWEETNQNQRLV